MKTKLKSYSLVLAVVLLSVGCGDNNVSENSEFKDARGLVSSLGKYSTSSKAANAQTDSLGARSGFKVNTTDYNFSKPMAIDMEGNILDGGVFGFINKEGHAVEIESQDENVVVIKVDLNGDGFFSENEIIVDKFDPSVIPPYVHKVVEDEVTEKLATMLDNESITIRIDLVENFIYPIEFQEIGQSTGSASVDGNGISNVTYFYNDKEITKEEMEKIQKENEENDRRMDKYRVKVNQENIEDFIAKNNIAKNDSIVSAIEAGFSHFELELTKIEIKELVGANKDSIYAVSIPGVPADEVVYR